MAKQEQVTIGINFDINKRQLQSLKTQLQNISKLKTTDVMASTGKDFNESRKALIATQLEAKKVEEALRKAYNPKLNTTNIEKFKQELGMSGQSLSRLRETFAKIGPQGELAFARIQNKVLSLGNSSRQTHKILQQIGTTLANTIKWTASSAAINKFTGSIQQAWGFTKSLDKSLNDIRIVTGKSAQEMSRFAEQANNAAKNLGKTTTDYTKAALIYAQQGLKDQEVAAKTNITLKAANVTGQSADQVSEQLTAVWNGYKVSAEEAELYVDRLAAVAATTASDLQELSTGMSKVASAAAALGVGEDQLAAQLSTIISVTRQAPETVGTALKTVYARITDIKAGVEEDGTTLGMYSEKMAEMGINVLDTSGNLRNMGEVIEQIGGKWSTYSREQQIYLAQAMAGQRQYSNLIALFDNFDKYNDAMKVAGSAAGTLQKQQEIYMDSIEAHINQLTASSEDMWKSMVDSDSMKSLIDFFSGLTKSVTWLIDSLGGGGNVLLTLGTIATTVFQKQMTEGLSKTLYNFGQVRAAALDYKAKIAAINLQEFKLGEDRQKEKEYYDNKRRIVELGKTGNVIPKQQADELERINDKLRETIVLQEAASKTANQANANLQNFPGFAKANKSKETDNSLKNQTNLQAYFATYSGKNDEKVTNVNEDSSYAQKIHAAINQTKAAASEYQKVLQQVQQIQQESEDKLENKSVVQKDYIKKLIPSGDEFKKLRDDLDKKLKPFIGKDGKTYEKTRQYNQNTENSIKKYIKIKQQIAKLEASNNDLKFLDNKSLENLEKIKKALKAFEDQITSGEKGKGTNKTINSSAEALVNLFKELSPAIRQANGQVTSLEKILSAAREGQKQKQNIENEIDSLRQQLEQAFQQTAFASVANTITTIGTGLMQALNVSQQIRNIGGLLGKEEVSNGQKILQVITSITSTLLTTVPTVTKNIQQLVVAYKTRKKATDAAAAATNGDTAAVTANKVATDAAKASAIGFLAVIGPIVGIVSVVVGVIGGLISAVNQYNEQQKKAASELRKNAIQRNNKLLEELEQQQKLCDALDELNQKYKQGEVSRADLVSQIDKLCDQYKLENINVRELINDYENLEEAILAVRKAGNQKSRQAAGANLTIATNQLLSNQYQETQRRDSFKPGDNYGRVFNPNGLSIKSLQKAQELGFYYDHNGNLVLSAKSSDPFSLARFQESAQEFQRYLASEEGAEGLKLSIYKDLESMNKYAQQHGQQDIIDNASTFYNESLKKFINQSEILKASNIQDYNNALNSLINIQNNQDLKKLISGYWGLSDENEKEIQEKLQNEIRQSIRKNNSQLYNNFDSRAQAYSKLASGIKLTSQQKQQIEDMVTNLSDSQIASINQYIEDGTFESFSDIESYYEKLILEKDAFEDKKSIDQLATSYQNFLSVLQKINKGQKVTKAQFEEIEKVLGKDQVKKYFTTDITGKNWILSGDPAQFQKAYSDALIKQDENNLQLAKNRKDKLENRQNSGYRYNNDLNDKVIGKKQRIKINDFHMMREQRYGTNDDGKTIIVEDSKETKQQRLGFYNKYYNELMKKVEEAGGKDLLDPDLHKQVIDYVEGNTPFNTTDAYYAFAQLVNSYNDAVDQQAELSPNDISYMLNTLQVADFKKSANGEELTSAQQEALISSWRNQWKNGNENEKNQAVAEIQSAYSTINANQFDSSKIQSQLDETNQNIRAEQESIHDKRFLLDSDIEDSALNTLTQTIKKSSQELEELDDNLQNDFRKARKLAEQVLRFDDGVADAVKNIATWQQQLNNNTLTSLDPIKDAYEDILGLNGDVLSDSFLRNGDNLEQLNIILTGTKEEAYEAYTALQNLASQQIISNISFTDKDKTDFQQSIQQLKKQIENEPIGAVIDVDENSLIQTTSEILNKYNLTAEQIKAIFQNLGIEVEIGKNNEIFNAFVGSTFDLLYDNISKSTKDVAKNLKKQQEAQVDLKELAKDQRDIYHDINIELEEINTQLSRVEKISKRLYGKDLINNLNKQQDILNKEIGALKTKQQIQKQDLQFRSQQLNKLGVTIGSNGQITNYMSSMTEAQNALDMATNQYNALAEAFNSSTDLNYKDSLKEQMDEANKEISKRSTTLNDLKTAISEYDNLRKEFEQVSDKIDDSTQKQIEINLQKFKMEAELRLDLGQAERQWNEFKRNVLERDNIILITSFQKTNKDARQNLSNAQTYFDSGEIDAGTRQLSRIMQAINNINNNGTDEIYGDNKAQAIQDGKTAQKQLMEELQSVQEALESIDQAYLDTIDNIHQMYSLQQQAYQTYGEQLSHDLDLVKLLYGEKNYASMDKYFKKIQANNINQLDFLKKTKQENYQQMKAAEARAEQAAKANGQDSQIAKRFAADAQKFREAYLQNISDINSLISESIQSLQQEYSNSVNKIFDDIEQRITNDKGFGYLDTQWELMKKNADLYLDSVNSAFAIKNTEFIFEKALNDTKGLKNQQQLRKVMDQQLQILKEKDKLTQYDVDRASKVLEIEKARIALEEARNNKTTMRLKRDSQGNYSYQFTADQDQINEAENQLAKAENDLYNFDKNQYEKDLKDVYDTTKEYLEKRKELQLEVINATPERQKEIYEELKLLDKQYNNYIIDLAGETDITQKNLLDSAIASYSNSYDMNLQNFNRMTDAQKEKWLKDMVPSVKSGIADLVGNFVTNPDSFTNLVKEATNELDNRRKDYQSGLEELEKASGVTFSSIQKEIDEATRETEEMIQSNDELLGRMDIEYDKIEELRSKGEELRQKYQKVTDQAKEAVTQFQNMWGKQQTDAINAAATAVNAVATAYNNATTAAVSFARATSALSNLNNKKLGAGSEADIYKISENKLSTVNEIGNQGFGTRGEYLTENQYFDFWDYSGKNPGEFQNRFGLYFKDKETSLSNEERTDLLRRIYQIYKDDIKNGSKNVKAYMDDDGYMRLALSEKYAKQYDLIKYFGSFIKYFDTGGYTGDWNSSQGKLAVLHEKELILNKEDTKNMLKMLQISREAYSQELETKLNKSSYAFGIQELMQEMQNMVQQNVLKTLDLQTKQLNSPQYEIEREMNKFNELLKSTKQQLEQEVKIEANFPNVNSRKEIEDAFANLVNLATQKALNFKK